jgi:putative chitinase
MILTQNQLEEASPYTGPRRLELILPNLNYTLKKYEIDQNLRIAHFLAQVLIESNYFRYIQDLESGLRYEGSESLGNTQKGDGRKFIGRGYIKLLGRKAYEEYKKHSGIDVITYPHYVTTPRVAMDIAGWIWQTKKLNILADKDLLPDITKILTGEYLILRERQDALKRVKLAIGLS